jgi:large subunit ribosomal protein L22
MNNEHTAIARGVNLPVSTKFSIEIANFIKGKPVTKARTLLEGVIKTEVAVPMNKFNRDLGHRRGPMTSGRYPVSAATAFLKLLHSAEMNAVNKGLDQKNLVIKNIIANRGTGAMRYGRHRGRSAKRTHIEIILEEKEVKKKVVKKTTKKGDKKE